MNAKANNLLSLAMTSLGVELANQLIAAKGNQTMQELVLVWPVNEQVTQVMEQALHVQATVPNANIQDLIQEQKASFPNKALACDLLNFAALYDAAYPVNRQLM